jgi:hypothetical protein
MKSGYGFLAALLWIASTAASIGASPSYVAITALVERPQAFAGSTVSVHGCLVYATDGATLGSCNIDRHWRAIVVSKTSFRYMEPIRVAARKNPHGSINCAVGDYVGTVVVQRTLGTKAASYSIDLKSFSNVALCPA